MKRLPVVSVTKADDIENCAMEFGTLPKIHATKRKLERQRVVIVQSDIGRRSITVTKKHGAAPSPLSSGGRQQSELPFTSVKRYARGRLDGEPRNSRAHNFFLHRD